MIRLLNLFLNCLVVAILACLAVSYIVLIHANYEVIKFDIVFFLDKYIFLFFYLWKMLLELTL